MALFRKHRQPEELGAMLYEALRSGMESDTGELSLKLYVEGLDVDPKDMDEQYVGQAMVGLMFGATLAIERSATANVAEQIGSGMKTAFLNHVIEQGADAIQKAEWENVIAAVFLTYRKRLEGYSGFEPPWKLGRELYWNVIGKEEYNTMAIKISTLYLLAARDTCQELLNEYGPTLVMRAGTY